MKRALWKLAFCGACLMATASARGDDASTSPIHVANCRIKPANQVTLSVNQSGILESVPEEGDRVDAGRRIILLESRLARAALATAEKEAANDAEIRHAMSTSDVATLEYEQSMKVNEAVKSGTTLINIRRRKMDLEQSLLMIEQARFKQAVAVLKVEESAAQLEAFHVVAPFAGTVTRVSKHKGEVVRQGDPILELVNTRRVRVEGYLDVVHRRLVTAGNPVQAVPESIVTGQVQKTCPGRVVFVDTAVQPVTRQVRFWADVENVDDVLLPGLTAVMTISPDAAPLASSR